MKRTLTLFLSLLGAASSIGQVHQHKNETEFCDFPIFIQNQNEFEQPILNEVTLPNGVDVNALESNPSADYIIYVDMDGEEVTDPHWINQSNSGGLENGKGIITDPALTDQSKYQIWQMISEDYAPFNINVTTNRAVFESKNYDKTQMVILGAEKNDWMKFSNAGVARVGGFSISNSPCFGFTGGVGSGVKNLGEVASHELGHTFGLLHDGIPTDSYYSGHGGWAPIMGVGYYKAVTQWSKAEYQDGLDEGTFFAGVNQDDVAIISELVGVRKDDHANGISDATLLVSNGNTIEATINNGVIETASDVDLFKFTTTGGSVLLNFGGANPTANLDIEVELLNSSGSSLGTYNTVNNTNATVSIGLASGTYYLKVDGVGEGNPLNTGYSDYASLGYYEISGTIGGVVAVPTVAFSSPIDNEKINLTSLSLQTLTANVVANEGVKTVTFEIDGQTLSGSGSNGVYIANWTPSKFGKYTAVATVTDNNGVVNLQEITFELVPTRYLQVVKVEGINQSICNDSISPTITLQNKGYQSISSLELDVVLDGIIVKTYSLSESFTAGEIKVISLSDVPLNYSGQLDFTFVISKINGVNTVEGNLIDEMASSNITHNGEVFTLAVNRNAQNVSMTFDVQEGSNVKYSFDANNYTEDNGVTVNYDFCLVPDCYDVVTQNLLVDEGCELQDWDPAKEYSGAGTQVMYNGLLYKALSTIIPAGSNPVSSGYWYTLNETCPGTNGALSYTIKDASNTVLHSVTVANYTGSSSHEICNNRAEIYVVYYDGNGNTSGVNPKDGNQYSDGSQATIVSKGSLVKTGYSFNGWNTMEDGSGDDYLYADKVSMNANLTLYAQWVEDNATSTDFANQINLNVYPNPVTDLLTIQTEKPVTISILDLKGVVVLQKEINKETSVIDVSMLSNGVYLLRGNTNENTVIKKITKR